MRLLVTGASGFLGRAVVREAQAQHLNVVGMGRGGKPEDFPGEWHTQNPFDSAVSPPVVGACIHLAWPATGAYATSPENGEACTASQRLIQRLRENGCAHVVVAGSCAEYAAEQTFPVGEEGLTGEETAYGAAKNRLHAALIAFAAAKPGLTVAWARIFQAYGPGESPQRLLPHLARLWQTGGTFQAASCTQIRDYLHVQDVARALVLLSRQRADGVFNVCSGQPVRLRDLILTLGKHFACGPLVQFGAKPERTGWEPPVMYGCNAKLCALGWKQTLPMREGVAAYAHFLQGIHPKVIS